MGNTIETLFGSEYVEKLDTEKQKFLLDNIECLGCKYFEECNHISHPELLIGRLLDKATNRYTCYEENIK